MRPFLRRIHAVGGLLQFALLCAAMAGTQFDHNAGQLNILGGPPAKALNISTRLRVDLGDNAMIAGFIISNGIAVKTVVLRGMGPSLGIIDALSDPVIALHGSNGALINTNNDWRDDPWTAALIQGTIYEPADDRESVMIQYFASPQLYTAVLTGRHQTTGIALVEVYDINPAVSSELANISTRGFVQTGNNVMIGGFILGGNTGSARVAIRGLGPSLAQAGITNPLADPILRLFNPEGFNIISNDDWQDDPNDAEEFQNRGLAPQNVLESGIFATLPPGAYTATLEVKDGTPPGVGLIEIYNFH